MKITDLSFSYGGSLIFSHLNLDLSEKVICLMSPSGKGKTTLLRLIAGLEKPQSGYIEPKPKKCAFMFQNDRLLKNLSALENVACVGSKDGYKEAAQLLEMLEIPPSLYPDEMSGGMCRRVALARAVHYGGDILLLDEPFNGLDEELKKKIAPFLLSLPCNIIMTTHDIDEAHLMGAKIIEL